MLGRGLRLLTVLAEHPAGLGVSAAARAARLPVSSAHRILGRLIEERFATYDEEARRYALGSRVLELSRGFQRSPAGYSAAAAPMHRLAARTGLPAIAGILDDSEVLLVLSAQGTQHLQLRNAEGTRNPWHATSLGKALAAWLPEEERERLLAGPLPAVTPARSPIPGCCAPSWPSYGSGAGRRWTRRTRSASARSRWRCPTPRRAPRRSPCPSPPRSS